MNFGFDFGFDVYALWEKKRPVLSLLFIIYYLFTYYLIFITYYFLYYHDTRASRIDTWHRKDLSQQKKFQNDEGAKQHMAPSTSQAAWTFVRVDWSPAATRKDMYDSWAIGTREACQG